MTVDRIPQIEVFKGLTKDEFVRIVSHFRTVHFAKDEIIIQEGQMVSAFYILMKGQLKVFLSQEGEAQENLRIRDVSLNILNEGDCFGEYSLIDKRPASASIVSIEPGAVALISEQDFSYVLQNDDHIARTIFFNMLKILIKRLRDKDREYKEIYYKLDLRSQTILKSFLPLIF